MSSYKVSSRPSSSNINAARTMSSFSSNEQEPSYSRTSRPPFHSGYENQTLSTSRISNGVQITQASSSSNTYTPNSPAVSSSSSSSKVGYRVSNSIQQPKYSSSTNKTHSAILSTATSLRTHRNTEKDDYDQVSSYSRIGNSQNSGERQSSMVADRRSSKIVETSTRSVLGPTANNLSSIGAAKVAAHVEKMKLSRERAERIRRERSGNSDEPFDPKETSNPSVNRSKPVTSIDAPVRRADIEDMPIQSKYIQKKLTEIDIDIEEEEEEEVEHPSIRDSIDDRYSTAIRSVLKEERVHPKQQASRVPLTKSEVLTDHRVQLPDGKPQPTASSRRTFHPTNVHSSQEMSKEFTAKDLLYMDMTIGTVFGGSRTYQARLSSRLLNVKQNQSETRNQLPEPTLSKSNTNKTSKPQYNHRSSIREEEDELKEKEHEETKRYELPTQIKESKQIYHPTQQRSVNEVSVVPGNRTIETAPKSNQPLEYEDDGIPLVQCRNCTRQFKKNRIEKHYNACIKQQARKVFKVDIVPEELKDDLKKAKAEFGQSHPVEKPKIAKWKLQSEQLRGSAGKSVKGAEPKDMREECPHCTRKFATEVLERHINFCKNSRVKIGTLKKGGGISAGRKAPNTSTQTITSRRT